MKIRKVATMVAGIVVGNMIAERYILKPSPDSPSGFVMISDGVGLDEVARAVAGVAGMFVVDKAVGMVLK